MGLALALSSALAMSTFSAQPARADGGVIAAIIVTAVVVKLLVFKGHVWAPYQPVVVKKVRKKRKK
jgi:hypothetical protein